ncbi:NTP transferase domain-containing protein [Candidatus Woesearchaeota archaeon]|nr:NTP transferase domain-containing protein [Candidatus Woesearchaeota archaeon]
MKKKISITIDETALLEIDSKIDNLLIRNRSQAIEYLVKNSLGKRKTAVILAGGKEEDLKIDEKTFSTTAKISNKSVVEKAVNKLRENGFKDIYIIARQKILTQAFDILKDGSSIGTKIAYIEEKSSKGTASSLKLAKGKINTDFLVVYGDIIFDRINLEELWNQHAGSNAMATIMLTTSIKTNEKGTVRMEGSKVLEFVQKPKKSDIYLVFSPIFAAEPELLEQEGNSLEYEVFPKLVEKGLLQGHLSSEKEKHIHTINDLR